MQARALSTPRGAALARGARAKPARGALQVVNVGWDPEGILAQPQGGHIERRMMQVAMQSEQELQEEREEARIEARRELLEARAARIVPENDPENLIKFFLDTEMAEMEYEVSRCHPELTPEFFAHLDEQIGTLRLNAEDNEEQVAELETLRDFLKEGMKALDDMKVMLTSKSAAERLAALLSAKDKKAHILEMAGNNEIDQPLIMLLQQNIDMARSAGQEAPAEFMEKVKGACMKYMISTPGAEPEEMPSMPGFSSKTYEEPETERKAGMPIKPKRKRGANLNIGGGSSTGSSLILDPNTSYTTGGSTPGGGGGGLIL